MPGEVVEVLEENARKLPRPTPTSLSALGLDINSRIEVSWDVTDADGSEESVWWPAKIVENNEEDIILEYDEQHGFNLERRRVIFYSEHLLWDALLRENLEWRREGAENDENDGVEDCEQEELAVEAAVKSRFQGGDEFHAGTIVAVNEDGTFDVLYEDDVLEQGVPREMIKVVKMDTQTQDAIEEVARLHASHASSCLCGPLKI